MTYYLLVALAGFLDSLNDDWRDRPTVKEGSRAHGFFLWLKVRVGWTGVWRWYEGTKYGQPLMRFWGIAYDFWHSVKMVKNFIFVVAAPLALYLMSDSMGEAVWHTICGLAVESAVFVMSYNVLLRIKRD